MNNMLLPTDGVGGSFWLLSMAMIGAAIFFLLERNKAARRWHTTMTLLGVVMLISAIHYYYSKAINFVPHPAARMALAVRPVSCSCARHHLRSIRSQSRRDCCK